MKKMSAQMRESERQRRDAACTRRRDGRTQEEGYVLLTLLLIVALMAIFAMGVIIPVKFENQRDQEQEMIHRGVQYSRAIRAYYKKFGRYPTKLDDLDNTNNLRYLRKHYKDPLNKNQDFRLLHYGEQGVTLGGGFSIGGGSIPEATPAGSLKQACLLEVGSCPTDAVVQACLSASEKLCSVVVGEPKLLGQSLDRFGMGMLLTVAR